MMNRDPVSKLCDVYSYGGIFVWELVTLKQPFSDVFPPFMVMPKVAAGEVGVLTQSVVICINCHTLIVSGGNHLQCYRCNCKSNIIMAFLIPHECT